MFTTSVRRAGFVSLILFLSVVMFSLTPLVAGARDNFDHYGKQDPCENVVRCSGHSPMLDAVDGVTVPLWTSTRPTLIAVLTLQSALHEQPLSMVPLRPPIS